jgi:hypothetical protein
MCQSLETNIDRISEYLQDQLDMVMLDQKKAHDDNKQRWEKIRLFEQFLAKEQSSGSAGSIAGLQMAITPGSPAAGASPPNPSIVRVSFPQPAAYVEIRPQMEAWLAESFGLTDYELPEPKPKANDFVVRFTGPLRTAALIVQKAFQSFYLGKGHYRRLRCVVADGGSAKILSPFFNPDKASAQLRREASGRLLKRIAAQKLPTDNRALC